jgi:hypothetical protein
MRPAAKRPQDRLDYQGADRQTGNEAPVIVHVQVGPGSTLAMSSPSAAKSADRIEGAILIMGASLL